MFDAVAEPLRLAPAAPADSERISLWIYETDPPLFRGLHGGDMKLARRHLAAQWRARRGLHSHAHAVSATDRGELAGIAICWDSYVEETEMPAHIACGFRSANAWRAARMLAWWGRYGLRVIPPLAPDAFYLAHLAVAPDRRGLGIGRRLMEDCIERARIRGYARLQLDVCANNPAVGLYKRMGLRTIAINRVPELEPSGFPPHLRMAMAL